MSFEKIKGIKILYCTIIVFLFLTLCSKCSFLYPFNDWVDVNYFFTVGKSMMKGMVLYKDIYEQKGPLIYIIYGIAYLFSHRTFLFVYFMEIGIGIIFLIYSMKCLLLYQEVTKIQEKFFWIVLPIYAAVVYSSLAFYCGGSVEEFTMPMQAITLYWLLLYFRNKEINKKKIFFCGFMAGCVFWMKFTLLGLFFIWMALIFFDKVFQKQYIIAIKSCVFFLFGMLLATVPWILYFGYHHAIFDCIRVYLYNNIFLYSSHSDGTLEKLKELMKIFWLVMWDNKFFSVFIMIGLIYFITNKNIKKLEKISLISSFVTMFLFIYIGGRIYHYYAFPFSLFSIFGMVLPAWILQKCFLVIRESRRKKFQISIVAILIIVMLVFANWRSVNTYMLLYYKSDLAQFRFEKIIRKVKNPVLLEYGCMDMGIYTVTDTLPICKYFCSYNIPLDDFWQEQNYYIENKIVDFVVCRDHYSDFILQNYDLVCEGEVPAVESIDKYYLFEKKKFD